MHTHPRVTIMAAIYLTAIAVALWLMPGAPYLTSLVSMAVLPACAIGILRLAGCSSDAAETVLIPASLILAIGVIANVWFFTTLSGGTDSAPVLINPDASRTWHDAMYYAGIETTRSPNSHGLIGAVYAMIFAVTGVSVTAGLIASMAMTLVTLVCSAIIACRISHDRSMSWKAMAATAAVCYLMASGMILIKDAWVIAAIALSATAIVKPLRWSSLAPIAMAAAILALARPNMILAIIIGIILFYIGLPRASRRPAIYLTATVICIALWALPNTLHLTPDFNSIAIGSSSDALATSFDAPQQMPYFNIVGDYHNLPAMRRLVLMPFSAAVQFFIPFPWNFMRDINYGLSQIYAHISYPWYLFGGIFLYYLFVGRRHLDRRYLWLSLWGIILWLTPCWTIGGTVSRYALPAVTLMAPAVAATISTYGRQKRFAAFMGLFAIVVAITLIISHNLQSGYTS